MEDHCDDNVADHTGNADSPLASPPANEGAASNNGANHVDAHPMARLSPRMLQDNTPTDHRSLTHWVRRLTRSWTAPSKKRSSLPQPPYCDQRDTSRRHRRSNQLTQWRLQTQPPTRRAVPAIAADLASLPEIANSCLCDSRATARSTPIDGPSNFGITCVCDKSHQNSPHCCSRIASPVRQPSGWKTSQKA